MLNLNKKHRYLLGCSYGPDSMALFAMLKNEGYIFEVAHVNYNLRKESTLEEENLKAYCANEKVEFHHLKVLEPFKGKNIEKACRDIRYTFFKKIIKKRQLDGLLVGHHQDDLIETYLMQIRRRNLVTYFGIREKTIINNIRVIRPLLTFSKEELVEYCHAHNVPYAIDKSNLTEQYLRNRIRHQIVAQLTPQQREKYLTEIRDKNQNLEAMFAKIKREKYETNKAILRLKEDEFLYALVFKGRKLKPDFKLSKKQGLEVRKIPASKKANVAV
ncbi:MAG: tRNA lysidine(34) synthetase TilS [Erysipelotrichia bacterium]|nr:tRNA lysidine(34) synthetase TilS [Erysipelotrichia bacterium]